MVSRFVCHCADIGRRPVTRPKWHPPKYWGCRIVLLLLSSRFQSVSLFTILVNDKTKVCNCWIRCPLIGVQDATLEGGGASPKPKLVLPFPPNDFFLFGSIVISTDSLQSTDILDMEKYLSASCPNIACFSLLVLPAFRDSLRNTGHVTAIDRLSWWRWWWRWPWSYCCPCRAL